MMNINFVFDRLSDQGIPVGNVLCFSNHTTPEQAKFTEDLPDPPWRGFWFDYSSSNFNDTFKFNYDHTLTDRTRYIKTSDIDNYKNDLNIYPIFSHGIGGLSAFTIEMLYYLDRKVVDAVNNDKLKIALLNLYDCYVPPAETFIPNLIRVCELSRIKKMNNVVVVCSDNDEWVEKTKKILSKYGDNAPRVVNSYWWAQTTKTFLKHNEREYNVTELYNTPVKDKIFTFLINRATYNRYYLYKYLESQNLIKHGFVSCRYPMPMTIDDLASALHRLRFYNRENNFSRELTQNFENYIENNKNIVPQYLEENGKIVTQNEFCPMRVGSTMDFNWIKNSYFSLYSETIFEQHFLSEKTYKLFYYGHPFMIYGKEGILKKIRNLGYKTFPMLFDETYDDLSYNSIEKLKLIVDQVSYLTTDEGKTKIEKAMPDICEVLEYNKKRFLTSNQFDVWMKLK